MAVHGAVAGGRLGRRRVWIVSTALAGLLLVLAIVQSAPGARLTTWLGLTPPPQSFTEVFADPATPLPAVLALGSSVVVPVTFTLGNGGADPASYRWSIGETTSAGPRTLATGTTDVAPGARRPRTVPVTVTCSEPRILLTIAVAGVAQPVTRHVACVAPR
ncbi:hypothetical protein [Actinomycetospora termitidis]|uniref:PKD domain-containing protein n=1 Tax=Actinomycetospora termitidis TaxID=3053470 RepID=A0ABT7MFW3_9PSEU|nr:hypothetical protein [Actinomycetospora sp. Odt1-22]MDL5159561.1 hypothetical protein [Actinomycetospora sp. Odt1-22]